VRIIVPLNISLIAKAPNPPFGDGLTSKNSVVKTGDGGEGEECGGVEESED
jgi:hypothetical protein